MKCGDHKSNLHLKEKHRILIKDILKIWEEDIFPITNIKTDASRNKLRLAVEKVLHKYLNEMKIAKAALNSVNSNYRIT